MDNKRTTVLLYSFISLLMISLCVYLGFEYLVEANEWLGLFTGIGFVVLAIPFHFLGKHRSHLYFLSFMFNIIGVGFSITSYYIFKQYQLGIFDFLTAISVSFGILTAFGMLSSLSFYKHHPIFYTIIIILMCFMISLNLWLTTPSFSGLTFYYLNVVYFFMIAMVSESADIKELSRIMSLISFGSFILISIIVLFIITEGEALDGIGDGIAEGFDLPIGSKRKKDR